MTIGFQRHGSGAGAIIAIVALTASGAAFAHSPTDDAAGPQEPPASQLAAAPAEAADLFAAVPVSATDLAAITGRENIAQQTAQSNNSAVVSNNKVGDNSTTGGVDIGGSAFQNVSGISMVNVNTGNNSSINAAMNVNVQINYASPGQ